MRVDKSGRAPLLTSADPGAHDLCGQPVSTKLSFINNGHAVASTQWIGSTCEQERGDVGMESFAGLDIAGAENSIHKL
jgi:hypothetical protein